MTPPTVRTRSRRRSAWLVFLGLLVVYGATATYRYPASTDVVNTILPAYRLAADGTLDMTPFADYIESRRVVREQFVQVDGRWVSGRNPGVIGVAVPVYLLSGVEAEPDRLPPLWPATAVAVMAAATAMGVLHHVLRELLPTAAAVTATAVAALGTTMWSTASDMLWTHGPSVACLSAALLACVRGRDVAAGFALGAAMLMRPELVVSAAVIGVWVAASARSWPRLVRLAIGPTIAATLLLVYFATVLGAFSPVAGHRDTVMLAEAPSFAPTRILSDVISVLTAPRNGLFLYSPFLLLLLPGLPRGWRAAPPWMRASAVGGLAHLLLIITIQGNGDGNFLFGYRFPLEMLALAAPLLALTWREHVATDRLWSRLFLAAAGSSVVLHGLAAILEWRR